MPNGIPVATVALNAAKNAGILSVSILSAFDNEIATRFIQFKDSLTQKVLDSIKDFDNLGYENQV